MYSTMVVTTCYSRDMNTSSSDRAQWQSGAIKYKKLTHHRETSSTSRNRIQSLLSNRFTRSLILGCDELWDFRETACKSEMIEASLLKLIKSPRTGLKVESTSTALTLRAMRASGSRPLDSESITACECLEENADNWETSDVMKDIEVV